MRVLQHSLDQRSRVHPMGVSPPGTSVSFEDSFRENKRGGKLRGGENIP